MFFVYLIVGIVFCDFICGEGCSGCWRDSYICVEGWYGFDYSGFCSELWGGFGWLGI